MNQPKQVYIEGFGDCYLGESLQTIPEQVRYYGSDDRYDVYGTNDYGQNRYQKDGTVEFYAIPQ